MLIRFAEENSRSASSSKCQPKSDAKQAPSQPVSVNKSKTNLAKDEINLLAKLVGCNDDMKASGETFKLQIFDANLPTESAASTKPSTSR